MDDLINRQAAIELIEKMKPFHQDSNDIAEMIDNMPSAQSDRQKGKWIKDNGDWFETMFRCSECGALIRKQDKFRSFFCYHCGTDMREGK